MIQKKKKPSTHFININIILITVFYRIEIPRDQNKLTVFIMCDITQNTKEIKMNIKKIVLRQNYFDHKQILRGQKS